MGVAMVIKSGSDRIFVDPTKVDCNGQVVSDTLKVGNEVTIKVKSGGRREVQVNRDDTIHWEVRAVSTTTKTTDLPTGGLLNNYVIISTPSVKQAKGLCVERPAKN